MKVVMEKQTLSTLSQEDADFIMVILNRVPAYIIDDAGKKYEFDAYDKLHLTMGEPDTTVNIELPNIVVGDKQYEDGYCQLSGSTLNIYSDWKTKEKIVSLDCKI